MRKFKRDIKPLLGPMPRFIIEEERDIKIIKKTTEIRIKSAIQRKEVLAEYITKGIEKHRRINQVHYDEYNSVIKYLENQDIIEMIVGYDIENNKQQ